MSREPVTGYDWLRLDPQFDGSCPCATIVIEGKGTYEVHCWRVCFQCEYAGVHFQGDRDTAEQIAAAMNALRWGQYEVREGLRR